MRVRLVQNTTPAPAYLRELESEFKLEPNSLTGLASEAILVHIARASSGRENTIEEPAKLIKYLIENNHWSPFQHTHITFEVVTSRTIGRQLLRHLTFTFQEFSQRYAAVTGFEPIELRLQADKNRQSSTDIVATNIGLAYSEYGKNVLNADAPRYQLEYLRSISQELADAISGMQSQYIKTDKNVRDLDWKGVVGLYLNLASSLYKTMLSFKIAKECARFILPETAETKLYMTAPLRSWIHYIGLREHSHAQKEAQVIATAQREILEAHFPETFNAVRMIGRKKDTEQKMIEILRTTRFSPETLKDLSDEQMKAVVHFYNGES